MPIIQCKHISQKEYKDRSFYIYELASKQTLWLCPDCNMLLAGQIMKQLATKVFLDNSPITKYDPVDIEEKIDEFTIEIEKLKKLNTKEVEDVRKRREPRKPGRPRRKKSKD